jgi:acetyl esterase/lipase
MPQRRRGTCTGFAASHIAVGGDSASARLTAALIQRLRAAEEEELSCCAWLVSPWTDSTIDFDHQGWHRSSDPQNLPRRPSSAYVDENIEREDPHVSPL